MTSDPTDKPWQREQSLLIALGAMPVGVSWAMLDDQRIVYMNRKFTEIFGYVVGDFESISDWIGQYPLESDRRTAGERWGKYFENPDGHEFTVEPMQLSILCKDGTQKTILHSGIILPAAGWALATFIDISDRRKSELLIEQAQKRANENQAIYRTLLEHSQEMIVLSAFDGSQRLVSPAVLQITGWTPEEYLSRSILELVHPEETAFLERMIREIANDDSPRVYRHRLKHKDGSYRWVETMVRAYADPDSNRPAGYVATVRDIGEQKEREDLLALENRRLSDDASQDELTRIPNRRLFNQTLKSEVRRQTRSTRAMALLMLDVDKFKEYNDHYGHLPGDLCLRRVAAALTQSLHRDSDLVARFGGEEFVILLPMTDLEGAEHIAQTALEAVRAMAIPHAYSPMGILTISIGVASWPAGSPVNAELFLMQADAALYRAKSSGRNRYCSPICETMPAV